MRTYLQSCSSTLGWSTIDFLHYYSSMSALTPSYYEIATAYYQGEQISEEAYKFIPSLPLETMFVNYTLYWYRQRHCFAGIAIYATKTCHSYLYLPTSQGPIPLYGIRSTIFVIKKVWYIRVLHLAVTIKLKNIYKQVTRTYLCRVFLHATTTMYLTFLNVCIFVLRKRDYKIDVDTHAYTMLCTCWRWYRREGKSHTQAYISIY
jgi:hypothetical protein